SAAVRGQLRGCLSDESALVRGAAARALLQWGVDDETHRAPGSRAMLEAHVAVARQDWAEVEKLGAAALPALAGATRGPDPAIRREAHWIAALLIARHAPAASPRRGDARHAPAASPGRGDERRVPAASPRRGDERRAPAASTRRGDRRRAPV